MKVARVLVAVITMLSNGGMAWSQAYPAKPVRVIVPFPPAGANDIVARIVFPKLADEKLSIGFGVLDDERAKTTWRAS